jgi:predicted amidophosphoribosyltransferase
LTKASSTSPLKNLARDQKLDALVGSISVDADKVRGKSLVVVDDLYQSGLTINYVAEELRAAGAAEVFGLAAVKTLRDDDNLPRTSPASQPDDQGDEDLF